MSKYLFLTVAFLCFSLLIRTSPGLFWPQLPLVHDIAYRSWHFLLISTFYYEKIKKSCRKANCNFPDAVKSPLIPSIVSPTNAVCLPMTWRRMNGKMWGDPNQTDLEFRRAAGMFRGPVLNRVYHHKFTRQIRACAERSRLRTTHTGNIRGPKNNCTGGIANPVFYSISIIRP